MSLSERRSEPPRRRHLSALAPNGVRTPKPGWRIPVALLFLGLLITGSGAWYSHEAVQGNRQQRFDSLAKDAGAVIERRVASHTEFLYGLRSLYAANMPLTRKQFHRYLAVADIQGRTAGAQAISFNRLISKEQKDTFEQSVRNDKDVNGSGYPTFQIHPETQNESLYVIDYLEPPAGNEAVFGYDLGSDPIRRSAVEAARDSGTPVATAPVRLLQKRSQFKGFLLVLAAYDRDEIPVTTPARKRAFTGVFGTAFSLDDMMAGVLGADPKVNVEIYDIGATISPHPLPLSRDRVLFDTNRRLDALHPSAAPRPNHFHDINVAERRWRIFATPGRGFAAGSANAVPAGVGLAGLAITLLVSGILYSFARSRGLAIGMANEMTASLRQREAELNEANVRLDSTNRELHEVNLAMEEFVATAAHDLRSPLTSILGFSATLSKSWESMSDGDKREAAKVIERQSIRLSRLMDDLLTLSRIGAGVLESHVEVISVREVVDEATEYYAQESSPIEVSVDRGVLVLADREQLRRIIANFVGNAVKYGEPPISIETRDVGSFIEIKVCDQGEGVPEEFIPRIFNRFSRAETARTRSIQGSGLGLSIVQGLARSNGGEVWYESDQTRGTCFTVKIPKPP